MGGLQTSAKDYAKWVGFLLSAWPPRDGADNGPVRRSTVRELAQGSNFPRFRNRPGRSDAPHSRQAVAYGMGMNTAIDDDLGFTLSHSGGYPGYGSHVLLLPDRGMAIFAFTNRTYGGPSVAVWDAAIALDEAGLLGTERKPAASEYLQTAYRSAGAIYKAGNVAVAGEQLAMNFLLDRDAGAWSRELAKVKAQVGECETSAPITATGALTGDFTWHCAHGRIKGSMELAPTHPDWYSTIAARADRPLRTVPSASRRITSRRSGLRRNCGTWRMRTAGRWRWPARRARWPTSSRCDR